MEKKKQRLVDSLKIKTIFLTGTFFRLILVVYYHHSLGGLNFDGKVSARYSSHALFPE